MGLLTIRPTGTPVSTSITSTSGTPHADLSDDSDSTVVRGTVDAAYAYFALGDVTLSAGQRVKSAKVRCRYARDAAAVGRIEEIRVRLIDTVQNRFGEPDYFRAYSSNPVTADGEERFTAPGPLARAWSEPIIDALQVEVKWSADESGLFLRVYELYVDVLTNSAPTVTAPTVTGATSTTRPSYAFDYADTDGDPRVRQQVKVFSAAQYGAAGFTPGGSTAVWDTGQVASPTTTGQIGTDLANGGTYKVAVRAAQAWSGPLGTLWWSDWQLSTAFTISLTPPPTPALTVSTQALGPDYRARVAVLAPINRLPAAAAGFDGGTVDTWATDANVLAPAAGTTNPKSGTHSMTMTSAGAGAMRAVRPGVPAEPGEVVTAVASFRAATAGRSSRVLLRARDITGALLRTDTGGNVTSTTTGYTQAFVTTAPLPTGTVTVDVVVEVLATGAAGEVHRVDEVSVQQGTSTTWTGGGLADTATVIVERQDRVDTRRGPATNWAHPQIASAGAYYGTTVGFGASSQEETIRVEPLDRPDPAGIGNTHMVHWRTSGNTAFYVAYIGQGSIVTDDPTRPMAFPAPPGVQCCFSLYLWAAAPFTSQLYIEWLDAAGNVVGSGTVSGQIAITTTPTRFYATGTAPPDACLARVQVQNAFDVNNADIYWTQAQWHAGSVPLPPAPGRGLEAPTWRTVRASGTATLATVPGQAYAVLDPEIPPARPVIYRARTVATTATGEQIASQYAVPVGAYLPAPALPILLDPLRPNRAVAVNRAPTPVTVTEDATMLHALGRDTDPIRQVTWRSGEDGELVIDADDDVELAQLRDVLRARNALLLQHHDGGQTYLHPDGYTLDELGPVGNWYAFRLPYVECGAP